MIIHKINLIIFTIVSNRRRLEKVDLRGLENGDLTQGELGQEFRSNILGNIESLDVEFNTTEFSLFNK